MSADTGLESRIAEGDLHFLDGLVLLGTIASQRWFGGKSRDVLDARVLDAGVPPEGPPFLALSVVEVRYGLQTHDLYHLPLGFRPSTDEWSEAVVAETEGWVAYDAIADPELTRRIVDLVRADATVDTGEAAIVFTATGELPERVESIRSMGAEQSNSSLVLDERVALKLYRRIEAGMNPELEVLRFLSARDFEHVAGLRGFVSYQGRPLEATLAILQDFVQSHGDGWVLTRESLASGWARSRPSSTTRWARIRPTRTSRPRSRARSRWRCSRPPSTRRSSRCSRPCPTSRPSNPSPGAAKRCGTGCASSRTSATSARRSARTATTTSARRSGRRPRTG
jgi:hypothetical protein